MNVVRPVKTSANPVAGVPATPLQEWLDETEDPHGNVVPAMLAYLPVEEALRVLVFVEDGAR